MKEHNMSSKAEWNAIVSWLWEMCRSAETMYEANLLLVLLDLYLQEDEARHQGHLSHELKVMFRDFVSSSFCDVEHKLLACHFSETRTYGKTTTSFTEAENSALKTHGYAPTPKDGIDRAQQKISKRTEQRYRNKRREVADGLDRTPTDPNDIRRALPELTRHASSKLWSQYDQASRYANWVVSKEECWVKLIDVDPTESEQSQIEIQTYTQMRDSRVRYLIPKIERTRIVRIRHDKVADAYVATCTCLFHEQYGMACRHIYSAFGMNPEKYHASFRWWRQYEILFLGPQVADEMKQKIIDASNISDKIVGVVVGFQKDGEL